MKTPAAEKERLARLKRQRGESYEFLREIGAERNRIRDRLKELDYLESCARTSIAESSRLIDEATDRIIDEIISTPEAAE